MQITETMIFICSPYILANVGVHPRRTLCAVGVERIVRIFILAARLFHSQLHIVFSSAESGRISGQADLHIFYPNVSVHPRRTLCAVGVERLVRRNYHLICSTLMNIPCGSICLATVSTSPRVGSVAT